MSKVSLHDVLQASYGNKQYTDVLNRAGYKYDSMLSNQNQKVWVNPENKKLLYTIAGTQSLYDWGVDAFLAGGALKSTNRYKQADNVLKQAKQKYSGYSTTVSGHSLGSTIGQQIASKSSDKFVGLDGGFTIGQKITDNKNFKNYRTNGDWVSGLAGLSPNMTTLKNKNWWKGPLISHKLHNIKNENIFI